jgi:hypothetical protein
MLVASSWSIMSRRRPVGFLSLFSRCRRSRSRRLMSRCFFSSSVMPLSASITDDSEFLRGRLSGRRCGEREGSGGAPRSPFSCRLRARSASSCDRVGRWFGGGPLRLGGPMPSRKGGGGPRRAPGGPGGGFAPSGLGGAAGAGLESSRVKEPCARHSQLALTPCFWHVRDTRRRSVCPKRKDARIFPRP